MMSENATLTHGLVRMLRWQPDCGELADRLLALHFETLAQRLGIALARLRAANGDDCAQVERWLDSLSNEAFARLLTAPRTCLELARAREPERGGLVEYLRGTIAVERGEREGWDCLGQFRSTARTGDLGDAAEPVSLATGNPVDYASPFALGPLPEVPGQSNGFDRRELELVLSRFGEAAEGIKHVPAAAQHFRRFVRSVMIRNDPTASSLRSASSSLTVGLAVFRNPHLENVNREDLAEGLIHEMIHTLCDIVEFAEPFVIDPSARDERVVSPWSGRSLDLDTYIQACFVWYGLWEFWLAAFDSGAFDARNAITYFQISSRGLKHGIVAPVEALSSRLSPQLGDALAMMETRVQSALKELAL